MKAVWIFFVRTEVQDTQRDTKLSRELSRVPRVLGEKGANPLIRGDYQRWAKRCGVLLRRETRRVITYRENNNNPTSSERNHVHLTCGKPAAVWRLLTPCNAVHPPILDVWETFVKPDVWETCRLLTPCNAVHPPILDVWETFVKPDVWETCRLLTPCNAVHPPILDVWETCVRPDVWETCSLMIAHTMQWGTPTHTGRVGNLCETWRMGNLQAGDCSHHATWYTHPHWTCVKPAAG